MGKVLVLQSGETKAHRVEMTAFQSMPLGWAEAHPPPRGSWDFDSSMAAAIAASMEGEAALSCVGVAFRTTGLLCFGFPMAMFMRPVAAEDW